MSKVLRADGSSGDAFARFDLPVAQPEVWVTVRLGYLPSGLSAMRGAAFSGPFIKLLGDGTSDTVDAMWFADGSLGVAHEGWVCIAAADAGGDVAANVARTFELRYVNGVADELFVDGVSVGGGVPSLAEDVAALLVGWTESESQDNSVVFIDSVAVGTTRGDDDLFFDDFEDGTLDAWSSTTGDVSVVDDPLPAAEIILTASDAASGYEFGAAVAISADGSTIVVGSPSDGVLGFSTAGKGKVFVYTGPGFATETILEASDGVDGAKFGAAVAVSDDGSVIVVGAYSGPPTGDLRGKVYVYSGADYATETILEDPADPGDRDWFGATVSISGDATTILVGAPGFGIAAQAHVYSGASWATCTTLAPSHSGSGGPDFGMSVALSADGSVAVVGMPGEQLISVFTGSSWADETTLAPSDPSDGTFGQSVDISADGSVIVATDPDSPTGTSRGRAFVYSGGGWNTETLLDPGALLDGGLFGASIAISPDASTIAVAQPYAPHGGPSARGRVVTFGGDDYSTITAGAGSDTVAGDLFGGHQAFGFGRGVDLSDDLTLIVGAPGRSGGDAAGAVYVDPALSAPAAPDPGTAIDGEWTFELCDQVDTVLADITGYVTGTVRPRLNRPFSLELEGPADQDVWKTIHTDDDPYLVVGTRTIKAKRNGKLIANAEIWRLDYQGDENNQRVTITCFDSMVRTGGRTVRDADGHLSEWQFDDPLVAGAFVQELFQNSVTYDDDNVPDGTPRVFPIDPDSGDFSADVDVTDVYADGPMMLGDLIYRTITDVGLADIMLEPTDTDNGSDPGIYGILHCVTHWGEDLTATVHFDYDTGDNNVQAVRRSLDMSTVTNRLRYLIAPKLRPSIWRGMIEATDPEFAGEGYRTRQSASREKYGTLRAFTVLDSDALAVKELHRSLWRVEDTLRVKPRQLVYLTPAGSCEFKPFADYNVGDNVTGNLGDSIGPAESGTFRIYGMDVTINANGVEEVGELIVSPDGAGFPAG